ncbi:MAG: NAD(P)/FAD-dependent oxidoreductase [Chloroflexia bacterium]|nr:NAD(P)/FAD-dependent oxidoreductase [Chloroflexia bacterium]
MYDVIIVGGGPAGLSAAITMGRGLRPTLLLDAGEPRNANAAAMHNFISRDGFPPAELRRLAREEISRYPTVEVRDQAVVGAESRPDGAFEVRLADGRVERARRMLLATGLVDELPSILGLAPMWGRSVLHCPYCHGFEVRNTLLAVLGATPHAVNLALHLKRFSDDVVLCTNGPADLDVETRALLDEQGVAVRQEPVVRLEGRDGDLERIVFAAGEPLLRQAMFCFSQPRQGSELPAQLGCFLLEEGSVEVDDFGQTSVRGVYAVGDMARRRTFPVPAAIIAAAASGTFTGAVIDKDLLATDLGLPHPLLAAAGAGGRAT